MPAVNEFRVSSLLETRTVCVSSLCAVPFTPTVACADIFAVSSADGCVHLCSARTQRVWGALLGHTDVVVGTTCLCTPACWRASLVGVADFDWSTSNAAILTVSADATVRYATVVQLR